LRPRSLFPALVLTITLVLCGNVHGQDIPALLSRSLNEAPSLEVFGSGKGFVVLRDISYRLLADGSTERHTIIFLHEGGGLPDRWRNWEIVVPRGGEASVTEAALYDPTSRRIQYPLIPRETERDGVEMIEVRLPNNFEGNILALSYRQVFPTRMNLEDAVPIDLDLPQWEQRISLTVPSGAEPVWLSEKLPDPQVNRGGAEDIYTWSVINTPAFEDSSLSPDRGRWILFSLRKGLRYSLSEADSIAASLKVDPPPPVASMMGDQDRTRGGIRIMEFMNDPDRLNRTLPSDLVRTLGSIPIEGPWTEWEASFLLGEWLRKVGWGVEILWDARVPLGDQSPATVRAWERPVLSLTPPTGKPFMFEIGQAVRPGSTPPRLWGRTVYSLEGSSPSRRVLPAGGPGDHRLSFDWAVDVSSDGMATGEMVITVRGAWVDTLQVKGPIDKDQVTAILGSFTWPSIPGFSFEGALMEPAGTGFRIKVPVNARIAIPGGEGLLIRMPSVVMPWQSSIAERGAGGGIRFPFVYEQSVSIGIPEGFDVMVLPETRPYDAGTVKLEESIRVRRGRTLMAEQKTVVSTARLDEQGRQALVNAVRQGLGWTGTTVPMKKR